MPVSIYNLFLVAENLETEYKSKLMKYYEKVQVMVLSTPELKLVLLEIYIFDNVDIFFLLLQLFVHTNYLR